MRSTPVSRRPRVAKPMSWIVALLVASTLTTPTVLAQEAPEPETRTPTLKETVSPTTVPVVVSQQPEPSAKPTGVETEQETSSDDTKLVDPTETTGAHTSVTAATKKSTTLSDGAVGEKGRGGYSSQPPFVPDSVDPEKVAKAKQELAEAQRSLAEAQRLESQRSETLQGVRDRVDALDRESADIVGKTAKLETDIKTVALASFKNPSATQPKLDFELENATEAFKYRKFMTHIAERDQAAIKQFAQLQAALTDEEANIVDETTKAGDNYNQATLLVEQRTYAVEQAEIEVLTYEAAGELFIPNVVFPLAQPYPMPLLNSYGFDRARGTADSHWHEGIDIFGPRGTPLLAAEQGIVTDVGSGRLGGLKVWITGESGTKWYYAHLDGFAPGLTEGMRVEAGDLIGYLGDSGNARGTPPHLHMEIHPPGKYVINPYPQLNVLALRDQAKAQGGQIDANDAGNKSRLNVSSG